MATIPLPPDFSAFLKLLSEHRAKYLLIGGYAVGYHGYVRATVDLDVWVPRELENAERLVEALKAFGFDVPGLDTSLFLKKDQVVRMGLPPIRIEIMTSVSGVEFEECYRERVTEVWDDVEVNIISLAKLKENKRAIGRLQDLSDLEHLP